MKHSLIKKILPVLLGSIALTAQAVPITGQINIQSGTVVLTPNVLGGVTGVGASTNGLVTSMESNYPATLFGDTVTYKPFLIHTVAQPITSLWSVTDVVGTGFSYTFDLERITSIVQSANNLFLVGNGTLRSSNPGLDPTAGRWTYDINSADGTSTSGVFSFQSNNVALAPVVPDGGNAVILFGLGLMGLAGLARKFSWAA